MQQNSTHHGPVKLAVPVNHLDHVLGSAQAPVTVVEYGDFECPACKLAYPAVKLLIKTFGSAVRFAYRHFPLVEVHPHAELAAEAAEAAGAQGKFWPMHDSLFATQHAWEAKPSATASFDALASSVGVDMTAYRACLKSPSIEALVNGDEDRASRGGVNSTPSFFLDGHLVEGAVPRDEMVAEIDRALAAHSATAGASAQKSGTSATTSATTSGTTPGQH